MKQIIQTGKTVDEAIQLACDTMGTTKQQCVIEILHHPKKGFLGLFRSPATVKVSCKPEPPVTATATSSIAPCPASGTQTTTAGSAIPVVTATAVEGIEGNELYTQKRALAVDFVSRILTQIGLTDAQITEKQYENGLTLLVQSNQIGLLIGRRGETLESLQFLTNIVANRLEGKYFKVRINCSDYRSKQDVSLRDLARSLGKQVAKTGEGHLCDEMPPHDRRIIHAQIAAMPGVDSKSKGAEPHRQVWIYPAPNKIKGRGRGSGAQRPKSTPSMTTPAPPQQELTIEEIIKQERAAAAAVTKSDAE